VEVRPAVSGFILKVYFQAGDTVKQGDLLFELDSRQARLAVDKAQAGLVMAQAKKKRADADLKRVNRLQVARTASPEEVDKITEEAAIAEAAVKTAEVEVTRARLELDSTRVTAPMSGIIGRPLVEPGTLVFRGQDRATLLTTVTSLDPIRLSFDMDERSFLHYRRLLRDAKVKGVGSALRMGLAGEDGLPHEGTLTGFDNHVSPQTGTVSVRGSFPNRDHLLLPGMYARVRMTLGPPRAVLEIPEEAILTDQGKKYVLIVGKDNTAERRTITLGPVDDGMRIVEKGLAAEDWVVVGGLAGVRPGDSIEPRKK
jgi:RND family efflux transporter MFP subunit